MHACYLNVAVDGHALGNAEQGRENSWYLYYDASNQVIN